MNEIKITDQIGNNVNLKTYPNKIISLVPSITELLFDLGLDEKVIGITPYCVHPKYKVQSVDKIKGPHKIDLHKIRDLQPDIVFASKEENLKEEVEELMKHYPVYVSDVKNLHEAIEMINQIGKITGTEIKSEEIGKNVLKQFNGLKKVLKSSKSACYLVWDEPMITVNKNTFIHDMMQFAGFSNVFADNTERYPKINSSDIKNKKPEYIILSTEPFSFTNEHVAMFKSQYPFAKVLLLDGEKFAWYGSHLLKTPDYFKQLF